MQIGMWVNRKGYPEELGVIGAIDNNLYFVQWLTKDRSGIYGHGWYGDAIIFPAPMDFDEQERDALFLDMALLSKDLEWAKEVNARLSTKNCE